MKNYEDKKSSWLPDHKLETLANCFLPAIREYFETPEGREAFATFQQEQEKKRSDCGA